MECKPGTGTVLRVKLKLLSMKEESRAVPVEPVGGFVPASGTRPGVESIHSSLQPARSNQRPVIVGFFLVFATLLFNSSSPTDKRVADKQFALIMETLTEAESQPGAGRYREIRVYLQNAFLRKDLKKPCKQHLKEVMLLNSYQANADLDAKILSFVDKYL